MTDFLSPIEYIEDQGGASIFIKRDDLIPFSYGGNKVKIAAKLTEDALSKGADLIISYGAPYSNLNRAVADTAKKAGLKCHVIIKREHTGDGFIPLNERLVREAGAEITYAERDKVGETVAKVLDETRKKGLKPYYVYGDASGRGNIPTLISAYREEFNYIRDFDHVFMAAGTLASISGLIAGRELSGLDTPFIHGISVARDTESALRTVSCDLSAIGLIRDRVAGVDISDRYLGELGGMREEIERMYFDHDIPLDPIYTGRAFYGMKEEIRLKDLKGRILFIHTGGYPCFLDYAEQEHIKIKK